MDAARLKEMISTGSPGLTDHALRQALKELGRESPRRRSKSPYAIPILTRGLDNAEALIRRAVHLQAGQA